MNCKGCGAEILEDQYKKVADWMFCLNCFDALMKPSEQKLESEESPSSSQPVKDTLDEKKEFKTCRICNADLDKNNKKKLGIWNLCDACHHDLTFRLEKKAPDTPDDSDSEQENEEPQDQKRPRTNQIIACSSCGRNILAVAAKQDDDRFFCPDCFYKKT